MKETLTRGLSGLLYIVLLIGSLFNEHAFLILFFLFGLVCLNEFMKLIELKSPLPYIIFAVLYSDFEGKILLEYLSFQKPIHRSPGISNPSTWHLHLQGSTWLFRRWNHPVSSDPFHRRTYAGNGHRNRFPEVSVRVLQIERASVHNPSIHHPGQIC